MWCVRRKKLKKRRIVYNKKLFSFYSVCDVHMRYGDRRRVYGKVTLEIS